eukprot:gene17955-biopygen5156
MVSAEWRLMAPNEGPGAITAPNDLRAGGAEGGVVGDEAQRPGGDALAPLRDVVAHRREHVPRRRLVPVPRDGGGAAPPALPRAVAVVRDHDRGARPRGQVRRVGGGGGPGEQRVAGVVPHLPIPRVDVPPVRPAQQEPGRTAGESSWGT